MPVKTPAASPLKKWLKGPLKKVYRYRHRTLKENQKYRPEGEAYLRQQAARAMADAIRRLRQRSLFSLNPIAPAGVVDPANGYPEALSRSTLMGYYGELFSGVAAEEFSPFGHQWKVPCYLFRFHEQAFFALERYRQSGDMPQATIGRHGDDCLAFDLTDPDLARVLVFEAKCLASNQAQKIKDAHENLSNTREPLPVSISQVIEVLQAQKEPDREWIEGLLRLAVSQPRDYERYDCVVYICRPPKESPTWIDPDQPHVGYTGGRKLAVVEVHIDQLPEHVKSVFTGIDKHGD